MTAKQWRMLEILDRHGGEGTMEVLIAWGDYDFGDTEAQESKGWNVCKLVVAGLVRSLEKKGYADSNAGPHRAYDITPAGEAILNKRRARLAKATETN